MGDVVDPLNATVVGLRIVALFLVPLGLIVAASSTVVAGVLARFRIVDPSLTRLVRLMVAGACLWISGPALFETTRALTSMALRGGPLGVPATLSAEAELP